MPHPIQSVLSALSAVTRVFPSGLKISVFTGRAAALPEALLFTLNVDTFRPVTASQTQRIWLLSAAAARISTLLSRLRLALSSITMHWPITGLQYRLPMVPLRVGRGRRQLHAG